ncbi:DNA polymerase I [Thermodesulfobacterium sp. TA1]|uniref:DNA polymerase I n=1 Tax=Thermodesulfobacterium sp. TA1 TaxID=2234087 RepID=UPI0012321B85|nr:DNA polymerase I [Thermodesulfobacterium sp. TA1]QER41529.1 DNA polymerase I [Thermodesulfobacterium sp. TA1]
MSERKEAVLIDGSSFIYRAYFAIPGYLATSRGLPTKAVFGVTQMIFKLLKEWNPEYIVWFMDEKEPTFRHEVYERYKATRPKMPDDLKMQIPYIKKIIPALGIPLVSAPGYEADDLIASFVKSFVFDTSTSPFLLNRVIIVAGDKDLYTLISDKVVIYDPIKETFLDQGKFLEKYGFPPEVFPEFRALVGDRSDNIPGVPGIGEKTAKDLFIRFKNLTGVYENLSKIPSQKLRENLLKYRDQVFTNLNLLKLHSEAPLPSKDLEFYRKKEPDFFALKSLFKELEFRKLLFELCLPEENSYKLPTLKKASQDLIEKVRKDCWVSVLPVNLESVLFANLNSSEIFLALSEEEVYRGSLEVIKKLAERHNRYVVYDYKNWLKTYQIFLPQPLDVKLAGYLLNPGLKSYELSGLFQEYIDLNLNGLKGTPEELSGLKAVGLKRLGEDLLKRLEEEGLSYWFFKVEVPLSIVLSEMEKAGIKIDLDYVKTLVRQYRERLKDLEEELFRLAGKRFNPRSSREVGEILFNKLNLPSLKKTPKSAVPSTDAEVLEELAPLHPFAKLLLQYRTLQKILSTYLEALLKYAKPSTYRIHTEFNQTGTATGRISSQNPNLQNIPIKGEEGLAIRRVFIAEEGWWLCSLDYSQIELRILAHFSEDENLIRAFEEGQDIHTFTASEVFGVSQDKVTPEMRRVSKVINFGIAYGMSPYGLSKELKISVKEAEGIIERYFQRYPGVKRYIEEIIEFAKTYGYVKTLAGRKRYIPEVFSSDKNIRDLGFRMAVNTPIQGSAADLIKVAMVALYQLLKQKKLKTQILLQIHDELLLEVPEEEIEVIKDLAPTVMEAPFEFLGLNLRLKVPIKVNFAFGKSWADCK